MTVYDRLKILADRIHLQPEDLAAIRGLMKELALDTRNQCVRKARRVKVYYEETGYGARAATALEIVKALQEVEV